MIYWPAKAPAEVEDFAFEFVNALQSGETIATRVVTVTGLTKNTDTISGTQIQVWLQDGTLGTPGIVSCAITTSLGRTYAETAILPIGEEPVSLDMAKRQLRVEVTTDDDYILELIQAAREYVEAYCGIRVVPAAVRMTFADFCSLERLSQAPVQSIVDVRYLDANGVEQILDAATYEFGNVDSDLLRPRIRLAFSKSWPSARLCDDAVRVNAVAGYVAVPRPVLRAILALITQWYDIRQPVQVDARGVPTEIPNTVTALLANSRR